MFDDGDEGNGGQSAFTAISIAIRRLEYSDRRVCTVLSHHRGTSRHFSQFLPLYDCDHVCIHPESNMEKEDCNLLQPESAKARPAKSSLLKRSLQALSVSLLGYVVWLLVISHSPLPSTLRSLVSLADDGRHNNNPLSTPSPLIRTYNLTLGARWLNLDGGRWRPMFVCNGESPCPTLLAKEGDEVHLHVTNDLGAQVSLHWSGMTHRQLGFWNDGTGGLNQFPILPRGNWTSKFETKGHWGLNWYADHSGAGVADGVYGMIYIAPTPERERPYGMIATTPDEEAWMREAEEKIQHVALWNSDFRTVDWKLTEMKANGKGLSCYKSILVNGKGRVFCKNPDFSTIDGQELDDAGCLIQKGFTGDACTPSLADFQVIETHGARYVMLNLINVGFEHALKFSIDDHSFWVVADDAGFIKPQEVDVVYITNGARYTILIKTDREPRDYAMHLASTSKLQNLEGMAVLRYPAKRYPIIGQPMPIPFTSGTRVCLNADSSVREGCRELVRESVRSLSGTTPPTEADITLKWETGSRPNEALPIVQEYFVNEKPWQLFRAAMEPVFFTSDVKHVDKPIQGSLPMGTVVDLIVQNRLNETIPMYKHGNPTFLLGSKAYQNFTWSSIDEALEHGGEEELPLDVKEAPLGVVHDLPPLGWLAVRWNVSVQGATMFHAVKLKYFAVSSSTESLATRADD